MALLVVAGLCFVHRRLLLDLLGRYESGVADSAAIVARFRDFVSAYVDCFERSCRPGHITGSAWIVSRDGRSALLTHHARLDRWLQLGGHADGDPDPFRVAHREAREESGLTSIALPAFDMGGLPLDLDIHSIPARGDEPEHLHYDVRYLFEADATEPLVVSSESHDLRWVGIDDLRSLSDEESLLRLARRTLERCRA